MARKKKMLSSLGSYMQSAAPKSTCTFMYVAASPVSSVTKKHPSFFSLDDETILELYQDLEPECPGCNDADCTAPLNEYAYYLLDDRCCNE